MTGLALTLSLLLGGATPELPPEVRDDIMFRALHAETARALDRLSLEDHQPPYFVGMSVEDLVHHRISASFGALLSEERRALRLLLADVRVGSRELDQTGFAGRVPAPGLQATRLPLEDDYDALRFHAWKTTDRAYKEALEVFSRKKAAMKTTEQEERPPDFPEQEPFVLIRGADRPPAPSAAWVDRVRSLSAIFREHPGIQDSQVTLTVARLVNHYLDSDGFVHRHPSGHAEISVYASTQASDGEVLFDQRSFVAQGPEGLAPMAELKREIERMAEELQRRRDAAIPASYLGPVLIEDRAAAELWRILLRRHAAAPRTPVFAEPWMETMVPSSRFRGLRGRRVLGAGITVVDDPTRERWNDRPLFGHYEVDEQGVPAAKVTVVQDGKLEGFLSDRTPGKEADRSNGHALGRGTGRRPHPRPAVVFVSSEEGVGEEALRSAFLEAVRDEGLEHGLVIRSFLPEQAANAVMRMQMMRSGMQPSELPDPLRVSLVDAEDGSEVPVRGLRFVSLDAGILREIFAVGRQASLYETIDHGGDFRVPMGREGTSHVSVITPNLAVEEMELRGREAEGQRLPLLPHPAFAEAEASK